MGQNEYTKISLGMASLKRNIKKFKIAVTLLLSQRKDP